MSVGFALHGIIEYRVLFPMLAPVRGRKEIPSRIKNTGITIGKVEIACILAERQSLDFVPCVASIAGSDEEPVLVPGKCIEHRNGMERVDHFELRHSIQKPVCKGRNFNGSLPGRSAIVTAKK